jgi:hypothetical protein
MDAEKLDAEAKRFVEAFEAVWDEDQIPPEIHYPEHVSELPYNPAPIELSAERPPGELQDTSPNFRPRSELEDPQPRTGVHPPESTFDPSRYRLSPKTQARIF